MLNDYNFPCMMRKFKFFRHHRRELVEVDTTRTDSSHRQGHHHKYAEPGRSHFARGERPKSLFCRIRRRRQRETKLPVNRLEWIHVFAHADMLKQVTCLARARSLTRRVPACRVLLLAVGLPEITLTCFAGREEN